MKEKTNISAIALVAAASVAASLGSTKDGRVEYKAKDGSLAVILAIGKAKDVGRQNMIEFYSPENQRLCSLDFSSEDGEHGFGVVKAAWTPGQNYFVFSLTSSGGHQPWHKPTVFYSLRDKMIRTLDTYAEGAGISKGDFGLEPPNTVHTEVLREPPMPVKFRLDSVANGDTKSEHGLHCANGKVFRVDPYGLRNHD